MIWKIEDASELLPLIWKELGEAVGQLDSPLRTPAFATLGGDQGGVRTVVLRSVDAAQRSLTCYSDSRAEKVRDLRFGVPCEWLFYDAAAKVQLRARCEQVRILTSSDRGQVAWLREIWDSIPQPQRLNYATELCPGAKLPEGRCAFPESPDGERAFSHFAVITTFVDSFDWLQLARDGHHRRVRFQFDPERGDYVRLTVVP